VAGFNKTKKYRSKRIMVFNGEGFICADDGPYKRCEYGDI